MSKHRSKSHSRTHSKNHCTEKKCEPECCGGIEQIIVKNIGHPGARGAQRLSRSTRQ